MNTSLTLLFCASLAWSANAESIEDRAYRTTRTLMAGYASNVAARDEFYAAVDADVRTWNAALRAAVEDESKFRGLDPRALIYAHLHRIALSDPDWSGPEWNRVRDELNRNLSRLLEHWNQGNKHLQQVVEIKLAHDLFDANDLPFLTRTYVRNYTEILAEPWLRLMVQATPQVSGELIRRLEQRGDTAPPLLAYALAYERGWARDEVSIRRLIRSLPGEITGEDMASARRTFRRAKSRGDTPAQNFRLAAGTLLRDVLTRLHVAVVDEDPATARAFREVKYVAKVKRTEAYERAIDLVTVAMRTGRGIDEMSDVARACGPHLAE